MVNSPYSTFLASKDQLGNDSGFVPNWRADWLYDFQQFLTEWAIRKGRAAIFADCGMGKTPMQLVWAQNVHTRTNKPVLIITPLAVSQQTVREGEKFQIECKRSREGKHKNEICVTNYERLHHFNWQDFSGVVCDESSILKNFDGKTKAAITEFMRQIPYRLLCTATASPNDYIELGTSSEALGELGYMDMLGKFFRNAQQSLHPSKRGQGKDHYERTKWRFRGHAEREFWRWVCSWARAIKKPSDYGFDDGKFILPPLEVKETIVEAARPMPGFLFPIPAKGLHDQRAERKHTLNERCEEVARKVTQVDGPSVCWCHLNKEADYLTKIIPDSRQISGADSDDAKEEKFEAFSTGQLKKLIIKPKIGAFGLNWQHCSHMTFFPSHSFEQYYQGVRRCWRFGQKKSVKVDIITTEGELSVLRNLQRKSEAAEKLFSMLVQEMKNELAIERAESFPDQEEVPAWL